MRDYRILSMDKIGGPVTLHPVALDVSQVAWADKQMWAPDAANKNDTYYLYFPAKDKQGAFRIGVATSQVARPVRSNRGPSPSRAASRSIRRCSRMPTATTYMYFGGIWGGQLQRNTTGTYDRTAPSRIFRPTISRADCEGRGPERRHAASSRRSRAMW